MKPRTRAGLHIFLFSVLGGFLFRTVVELMRAP